MICAVIPTRYHPPELSRLLATLQQDGICVHLAVDPGDHRLHSMWNAGCDEARAHGADHIAVLNDDIEMWPGTLPYLARAFRRRRRRGSRPLGVVHPDINAPWGPLPRRSQSPQTTTGPWVTGFCFMFSVDVPVRFDERYIFDCGDIQFVEDVQQAGWDVGRVPGVRVRHEHAVYGVSSGYSVQRAGEEIHTIRVRDMELWTRRHPLASSYGSSYR